MTGSKMRLLKAILLVHLAATVLFARGKPAVPFLLLKDQANGMAGSLTAVANDAGAMYFNPAAIAGVRYGGIDYRKYDYLPQFGKHPLHFLAATFKIPHVGAFGIDYTRFDLGEHIIIDEYGNELGRHESKQWALSLGYARCLTDGIRLGGSIKYIKSDMLTGGRPDANYGIAFDIGVLFERILTDFCFHRQYLGEIYNRFLKHRNAPGLSVGMAVSNIGPYLNHDKYRDDPLPQRLRLGVAWNLIDTDILGFLISADTRKLLIKTYKDGSADPFYQAWFTSWEKFSFDQLDTSIGVELSILCMASFQIGRYFQHNKYGGIRFWSYGIAVGPETIRLKAFYINHDQDLYWNNEWHMGFSIAL